MLTNSFILLSKPKTTPVFTKNYYKISFFYFNYDLSYTKTHNFNYICKMKIGIIKEGKTPPDERVPLSPTQCKEISEKYPALT